MAAQAPMRPCCFESSLSLNFHNYWVKSKTHTWFKAPNLRYKKKSPPTLVDTNPTYSKNHRSNSPSRQTHQKCGAFLRPPLVFRGQEVGNGPPHNEPRERGDFALCLDHLLLILVTLYVWTTPFAIKRPRLYDEFTTEGNDLQNKCTKID